MTPARAWHLLTAVVALAALGLQLVLIVSGSAILVDHDPPNLAERLGRFIAYFTIQSNALVAITTVGLARNPDRDGVLWRVVRLAAVGGITVTGLVHWFLLRPLLDLHGADLVADKLLHLAVPILAVGGWAAFGPRPRIDPRVVGWALLWPIAWLAETLVVGQLTGWLPYPFLNADKHGWGSVIGTCVAITVLFLVVLGGTYGLDRRLRAAPQPAVTEPRRG